MYAIIGANGFLGSYLIKSILENTGETIIATARNVDIVQKNPRVEWVYCDVEDDRSVLALADKIKHGPLCRMIYLAAYHHPDMVAKNPKIAWNINITALSGFLNEMENLSCFFYPSTDSVYGEGEDGYHFKETDSLSPVNLYGVHKAAAESLVNWYGYHVVRYPFLIAPSLLTHKKHFYDVIVQRISQGRPIEMFMDSKRSSLDFGTAADLLIRATQRYSQDMPKIMNLSGDEDLFKI